MVKMAESESTTPNRYEFQVVTTYSIFADSDEQADAFLAHAMEHSIFSDNVNINKFTVTRTAFLENGEKEAVWNQSESKWEPTRFNLR
jgi:hypothetical protein